MTMTFAETAFPRIVATEGGYGNDPQDAGGETVFGVSRVFWPSWPGWPLVAAVKRVVGCPDVNPTVIQARLTTDSLKKSPEFMAQVVAFYRVQFWDRLAGDALPFPLAYFLFQLAVNVGLGRAVQYLQASLNYMNRNGLSFPDLLVDGGFGGKTLAAIKTVLAEPDGLRVLMGLLRGEQIQHYKTFMSKRPDQEKFCRGWILRTLEPVPGETA